MLEGAPKATGVLSPENIALIIAWAETQGITVNEQQVVSGIRQNPGFAFFEQVEQVAQDAGKRIAFLDPAGDPFSEDQLQRLSKNVEITKGLTALGGVLGYVAMAMVDIIAKSKQRDIETAHPENQKDRAIFTRRQVMKGALGLISSIPALSLLASINTEGSFGHRTENLLGTFVYNAMDYRDVIVAEGIDVLLAKQYVKSGTLLTIYGNGHIASQIHYLTSPKERAVRKALYAPFESDNESRIRVFEPTADGWRETPHS